MPSIWTPILLFRCQGSQDTQAKKWAYRFHTWLGTSGTSGTVGTRSSYHSGSSTIARMLSIQPTLVTVDSLLKEALHPLTSLVSQGGINMISLAPKFEVKHLRSSLLLLSSRPAKRLHACSHGSWRAHFSYQLYLVAESAWIDWTQHCCGCGWHWYRL